MGEFARRTAAEGGRNGGRAPAGRDAGRAAARREFFIPKGFQRSAQVSLYRFGMTTLGNRGGGDVFVAKLDTDGNSLWVKQAGGGGADNGIGIATDDCGNAFVSGSFSVDAVFGITNLTSRGGTDVFVTRIDDEPPALSIAIAGNEVLASWPSSSRCFQLESTTNLSSSNFRSAVGLAPTRLGTRNVVTNQLSGGAQFYRLRKP